MLVGYVGTLFATEGISKGLLWYAIFLGSGAWDVDPAPENHTEHLSKTCLLTPLPAPHHKLLQIDIFNESRPQESQSS